MVKCPICTAENEDTERFCRDCGQKLPTASRAAPGSAPDPVGGQAGSVESPPAPGAVSAGPPQSPTSSATVEPLTTERDPASAGAPETGRSITCPNCSASNDSTFRFCKLCGTPLASQAVSSPTAESATLQPGTAVNGESPTVTLDPSSLPGQDAADVPGAVGSRQQESGAAAESITQEEVTADSGSAGLDSPAVEHVPSVEPMPSTAEAVPPGEAAAGSPVSTPKAPESSTSTATVPAASTSSGSASMVAPPPPTSDFGQRSAEGMPADSSPAQASDAIVCPSCGKTATPGERFCSECGARLVPAAAPPPPTTAVCPTCSAPFVPGDKFCKNCGSRLPPAPGAVGGPKLVLVTNGEETVYPLTMPELSIGRHPSNEIAISSDGYISSHHARVIIEDGAVFVEDAGSTNGTFLRVHGRIQLTEGDEIKVGQSILRYQP